MIKELALQAGIENADFVDAPFDHLTRELSEISI
jgi:phycobilisome core component